MSNTFHIRRMKSDNGWRDEYKRKSQVERAIGEDRYLEMAFGECIKCLPKARRFMCVSWTIMSAKEKISPNIALLLAVDAVGKGDWE